MSPPNTTPSTVEPPYLPTVRERFLQRFSLRDGKAADADIDAAIRESIELRGATPWVLVLAIFIASIGLNVNSTAVVIGAMLISPLMNPIMGVGYGVGIDDPKLVRRSLSNLAIAAAISLVTSTLYFLLTPLTDAQSELLARTSPTIWDVLIALFGGLAGMIGASRTEKTNLIPGVAIATALMPPLCTAGYGLATGGWGFFIGALYLFTINGVFIAAAAAIVTGLLGLRKQNRNATINTRRMRLVLWAVVLLVALPSAYLAVDLVRREVFSHHARTFVQQRLKFENTYVVASDIRPGLRTLEVTLVGEPLSPSALELLEKEFTAKATGAHLLARQWQDGQGNAALSRVSSLEAKLLDLKSQADANKASVDLARPAAVDVARELMAQYPGLLRAAVGYGSVYASESIVSGPGLPILALTATKPLSLDDQVRIKRWFAARTQVADAQVIFETVSEKSRRR